VAALQSKASGRYGLPECWLYAGAGQTYEIFNREVEEPIVKALSASLRLDAKSRAQAREDFELVALLKRR